MSIRLACSKCQKKLQVPDKLQGKQIKCPQCGTRLAVGRPAKQKAGVTSGDDPGFELVEEEAPPEEKKVKEKAKKPEKPAKKLRPCPECEEMIPEKAVVCRFCGAKFDLLTKEAKMREEDAKRKKKKSQGNGPVMAIVALVAIAVAGGAIYYFMFQ